MREPEFAGHPSLYPTRSSRAGRASFPLSRAAFIASIAVHVLVGYLVIQHRWADVAEPTRPPAEFFLFEIPAAPAYEAHCSVCHGERLEGASQGPPLVGVPLSHGESLEQMTRSIADGISNSAMPAWSGTLVENQILQLAIYIQELRKGYSYADFNVASPLVIPSEVVESQELAFRVETFATGISSLPYSIAPLPDGSVLLTEKTRGLRVVSPEGVVSELIDGTPRVYSDGLQVPGILLVYGLGWMLDIAPHPDYEKNGWIYLMYGDRCADCNKLSRTLELPVSMNKLVRGRIKDGAWVDQEVIWQAPIEAYTQTPDIAHQFET
jgi:mono/diheme cytochrome c family protein